MEFQLINKKSYILFALSQVLLLGGIFFIFTNFDNKYKNALAVQSILQIRNDILTSNHREVIKNLNILADENFYLISFFSNKNEKLFEVQNYKYKNKYFIFLPKYFYQKIYFDDAGIQLFGEVKFYYNYFEKLSYIVTIWFLCFLISLLLYSYSLKKMKSYYVLKLKSEQANLQLKIASQVAHDIRSPLSVLNIILNDLTHLDQDEKKALDYATTRIKEIADDLLAKNRTQPLGVPSNVKIQPIRPILDEIVLEKELKLKGSGIVICYTRTEELNNLNIEVDSTEIYRSLSNIINNAIEALADKQDGKIQINAYKESSYVNISVEDNGCGIPEDILPKLKNEGATFNKEGGSGLGLYAAFNIAQKYGGNLEIFSKLEEGTKILFKLRVHSLK